MNNLNGFHHWQRYTILYSVIYSHDKGLVSHDEQLLFPFNRKMRTFIRKLGL